MNYKERINNLNTLRKSLNRYSDDLGRTNKAVKDTLERELTFWENCKTRAVYDTYRGDVNLNIAISEDSFTGLIEEITKRIEKVKDLAEDEYRKFGGLASINDYDDLASKRSILNSTEMDSGVRNQLLYDLESNAALIKTYQGMNQG